MSDPVRARVIALAPVLVALAGAVAYLVVAPASADLAAQEYRAALVGDTGLAIWNGGWYGGHHTPAYSVLSPLLGALLGVRLVGALAAVAATALFAVLARRHFGEPGGTAAGMWFAAAMIATLLSGRLAFALGAAFAVAALVALQSGRRAACALLAVATTLASPVAGLFLALAVLAWGCARPRARAAVAGLVVAAALVPAAALAIAFPEGGSEPFVASAFWPALVAIALVAALLPARERELRIGAALYALLVVSAFAVASPLGGNATRLGALVAGAAVLGALAGRRKPALLALLVLPFAYWIAYPAARDVVRAAGDPSVAAAYYAPLLAYLEGRPAAGGFRVEIPFTENHWEARHVAPRVALARGWERQLDRRYGALFYDGALDARRYRAWLDAHAVAYVALPDVPLDGAARAEARLVADGLPYLRRAWTGAHWRVFAVRDPAPLAAGPGRRTTAARLVPGGFELRARRAGSVLVQVRNTRWWTVTRGRACVAPGPGGMTRVQVLQTGRVRVEARLRGPRCRR